jgi:hypothetical protein
MLNMSCPEAALPSTLLDASRVWLSEDEVLNKMLFMRVPPLAAGKPDRMLALMDDEPGPRVVAAHDLEDTSALKALPVKFFALPDNISVDIADAKDMKPCLAITRLTSLPVLMLYGETSVLYMTLVVCSPHNPAHMVITEKEGAYVLDGWSDKDGAWKKLVKEKKVKNMKTLNLARPALNNTPAAEVTEATVENTRPEEAAAVNAQVGTPTTVPLSAIPLAEMPKQEAAEVAPVNKDEDEVQQPRPESSEHSAQEQVQEDAKPRIRRAPKPTRAVGVDLSKVIETISSDVDDITAEQFDAALNEIRALRDLQIAAARRMTNLCTAMCKFSQGAIDKYNKVLNALK